MEVKIDAYAIEIKTDDGRDTREILKVDAVLYGSEQVLTKDKDGSFVHYRFTEVIEQYKAI